MPINENALVNQLCPYCLTHLGLKRGAEVCSSCGREISWITSEKKNNFGVFTAGICKPGEEEEAKRILGRVTVSIQRIEKRQKRKQKEAAVWYWTFLTFFIVICLFVLLIS